MLSTHTVKPNKRSARKRKRVGRGNASGHGTYSGKGLKGQKSRSGVSGLKRLGMKQVLLRTPKKRGFKSQKEKSQIVKLSAINEFYKEGEEISPRTLYRKKLIKNTRQSVKILGPGALKINKLKFRNIGLSASVRSQLEKAKGSAE